MQSKARAMRSKPASLAGTEPEPHQEDLAGRQAAKGQLDPQEVRAPEQRKREEAKQASPPHRELQALPGARQRFGFSARSMSRMLSRP